MNKNTCVVFLTRRPSTHLKKIVDESNKYVNTYIVSSLYDDHEKCIHAKKDEIFKDFDEEYLRIRNNGIPFWNQLNIMEVSKSLVSLTYQKIFNDYEYFLSIEDDTFIKNPVCIEYLLKYYDTDNSDIIGSCAFAYANDYWLSHLERYMIGDGLINNRIMCFSPVTRYSKRILLEARLFFEKYGKIYFHEIFFPSICEDKKWPKSVISRDLHKFYIKAGNYFIKDFGEIVKQYNFIHPIKFITQ